MCKSTTCKVRETCYRNAASGTEPNPHRQAYAGFAPTSDDGCKHFWLKKRPTTDKENPTQVS